MFHLHIHIFITEISFQGNPSLSLKLSEMIKKKQNVNKECKFSRDGNEYSLGRPSTRLRLRYPSTR